MYLHTPISAYTIFWLKPRTRVSCCTNIHQSLIEPTTYPKICLYLDTPMSGSTYTLHCMVLLRYTKCMVVPTYSNVWLYLPRIQMFSCTYIRQNIVYQHTEMSGCTYTHKISGCNYTHKYLSLYTAMTGCTYTYQCLVVPTHTNVWFYLITPMSGRTYYRVTHLEFTSKAEAATGGSW